MTRDDINKYYAKWFDRDWGLHSVPYEPTDPYENRKRKGENGIVGATHFWLMLHELGLLTQIDVDRARAHVIAIQSYDSEGKQINGLFDRGSKESLTVDIEHRRTISHDNLTAIVSLSRFLHDRGYKGFHFHEDVYNYGRKHWWRYDNCYPESPRTSRTVLNPANIVWYGYCGSRGIRHLFWSCMLPLWALIYLYSCKKKYKVRPQIHERILYFFKHFKRMPTYKLNHTDGKLLFFDMTMSLRGINWFIDLVAYKGYVLIAKLFYPKWLYQVMATYYDKHIDHPNRILAEELCYRRRL